MSSTQNLFKIAYLLLMITGIVIKYSGLAIGFGPFLGENLWQLSRLVKKHKHVNATYSAIYNRRNQNSINSIA